MKRLRLMASTIDMLMMDMAIMAVLLSAALSLAMKVLSIFLMRLKFDGNMSGVIIIMTVMTLME